MNLYLDDVRSPPDDSWTLVRTAEEARAIIASGVVECASLDHDLGECDECAREHDDDEPVPPKCRHRMNGYDLVKWMALTGRWPKRKPVVHSSSKTGRANMVAAIERHWRPPARPRVPVAETMALIKRDWSETMRLLAESENRDRAMGIDPEHEKSFDAHVAAVLPEQAGRPLRKARP
jgi:hypothetical protein